MLCALDRPRAALDQIFVARRLLLGEHERGLGLLDLGLAMADLGLLHGDLGVHVADVVLGCGDLCVSPVQRDAIIAIVDTGDDVARRDMLVVGHRHRGDVARDLGRDGELASRDEGVVGRFEMAGVVPIDIGGCGGGQEDDQAERRSDRMAAEPPPAGLACGLVLSVGSALRRRLGRAAGWLGSGRRLVGGRAQGDRLLGRLRTRRRRRRVQRRRSLAAAGGAATPGVFGHGRVLEHVLAVVSIPVQPHDRNSKGDLAARRLITGY